MDNGQHSTSKPGFPIAAILLLLVSTGVPVSAQALRFHSYINEQGETVFSNLPAKCIDKGRLTCLQHHPLSAKHRRAATPLEPATKRTRSVASSTPAPSGPARNDETDLFNSLDQVVEIKRLLDEYYPQPADPETVRSVKEQQERIMGSLKLIRNVADQQELPAIDRAIKIFQTHRID